MMMMMDYGSQYASSTMSSETLSGSCGSRTNRIRTVRLVRPTHGTLPPPSLTCRHGPSLGFSVRGGREHGTGFFVSHVEPASEAHRQGLRVGDQIIRVNGFTVDDAVHKEVLQLISNHTHLTLKVRSVGMIPVKDKKTDTLSWQIITDNSSLRSSPPLGEKIHDVRINIIVAPRSKLGCGICKGPEWKPGIFIQFTKEGGIAREAGLRPGDQILFCNNVDFSDIPFNEAVNLMKTSRQLDLIVRKSAGSELFPGESSGYNSSASSVTGDQSPSWSDQKRLSIVKEESLDLEDRLDRLKSKKWEKIGWDDGESEEKQYFKPTIINLSENGTTIKNNGTEEECQSIDNASRNKLAELCLVSQQHETKTVVVEVHRSNTEQENKTENTLVKSSSTSSFGSLASRSSTASSSLSSAICQEIQRRSEKKQIEQDKPSIDEQLQMKKILKGVTSEKQSQHNKLMDEFKKAHRKMFKAPDNEDKTDSAAPAVGKETLDRIAGKELSQKLSERLSNLSMQESLQDRLNNRNSTTTTPPPPPPPPIAETTNGTPNTNTIKSNKKGKAPPVPVKTSTLSYQQPPPCPTPDYDTLSITSTTSLPKQNGYKPSQNHLNDSVEMESLESFKLNNPGGNKPKPPNTYFKMSNGTASSTSTIRKQRPVSVTIGEYPSGTMRKTPGRLDFLQNGTETSPSPTNTPISNQLASELAQTLNRSNLRKRTESMENLLNCPQIKPQSNGSVRISLNTSLAKSLAKSTNDLTNLENFSKAFANRVTINVNTGDKKTDTPNGILKNGTHKPLMQQKSITFGEMPTVINDRPLHVS
ncbi:harmonin isoform X1 [Tribolium castaneum]|uniref:harmonin isoform X1 n=1 Tax=Tribolium castaneum TaxID=7070 RepID=UPI0030FE43EE